MLEIIKRDKTIAIVTRKNIENIDVLISELSWKDIIIKDKHFIDLEEARAYKFSAPTTCSRVLELTHVLRKLNKGEQVWLEEMDYKNSPVFSYASILRWIVDSNLVRIYGTSDYKEIALLGWKTM